MIDNFLTFILCVMLFLISQSAFAQEWKAPSNGEIAAIGATEILIAVDIAQTIHVLNRGAYETNPILGRRPSTEQVIAFGICGGLASAALWLWLPPKVRYLVPAVVGTLEIAAIANGYAAGLRLSI